MIDNVFYRIWMSYRSHRNIELLKQDVLTAPWYYSPTKAYDSLLHHAVTSTDMQAARLMIELGEAADLPADDGFPLLHLAVDAAHEREESEDSLAIIELLIEHGADLEAQGHSGTALHRAAGFGVVRVAELLLRHGANIEARMLVDGEMTPLMHAALMNQPVMVRFLIQAGADLSARCAEYMGGLTAVELVSAEKLITGATIGPDIDEVRTILRDHSANR